MLKSHDFAQLSNLLWYYTAKAKIKPESELSSDLSSIGVKQEAVMSPRVKLHWFYTPSCSVSSSSDDSDDGRPEEVGHTS